MPLLDHYHPPLSTEHPWESFHSAWAGEIMRALNLALPRRYRATVKTSLGRDLAADVSEFERTSETPSSEPSRNGGTAVLTYAPPAPTMVMPAALPDDFEVRVQDTMDTYRLVGVIELVSPRNLDRPEARRGFAGKCAAYIQKGLGLVVADIVPNRLFNLHNELVRLLELPSSFEFTASRGTYAVAYRPAVREGVEQTDVWAAVLTVGQPLPTLPLALLGGPVLALDLERYYTDACEASRLP